MASGTLNDPYIVNNWNEFLEYNTFEYEGSYVQFNARKIDFGRIYPKGHIGGLVIYPNILGGNCHWYHLCLLSLGGGGMINALEFKGDVKDLYIDALYVEGGDNLFVPHGNMECVYITCQVFGAQWLDLFGVPSQYYGNDANDLTLTNCEIDIRASHSRQISFNGGNRTIYLENTLVNLDLSAYYDISFGNIIMTASMFQGYIRAAVMVLIQMSQSYPIENAQSLWNVKTICNTVRYINMPDTNRCHYNVDKTTFTDTTPEFDWIALTNDELEDATALIDAGFPVGGDSPWELIDGELENVNWVVFNKLGAFTQNITLRRVDFPMFLRSIGHYSFSVAQLPEVTLPPPCTYYATSFSTTVHGGILIE